MNTKRETDTDTQPWKEELLQEGRIDEQSSMFEKVQQNNDKERSPEEEADLEQQHKEALTERD